MKTCNRFEMNLMKIKYLKTFIKHFDFYFWRLFKHDVF